MNNKKKNNIDGIKKKSISSIKKVSKRSAPEVEIKRESSVSNTEAIRRSRKYNIKKVSRVDVDPSLPVQKRLNKRLPPLKEVNFASNKKKKTPRWVKTLISVILGLIVSAILINQFDSAVIRIQPMVKKADVSRTIVTVDEGDSQQLEFSMIAFSETQTVSLRPDTQKPSDKKASGTIRIFNDYSTAPQRLSPLTRFESVDGKIFMLGDEGLIIPGKEGDTPGEVLATVYAKEPGEEYNIDVTDFSIPGFLELGLDEKYTAIYALSTEAFTGGSSGMVPSISDSLKDQQTKDLEQKVQSALEERLLSEKTSDMQLVENSVSIVFKEPSFVVDEGEDTGTLSVTGSIYALLLDTEKLASYLAKSELGVSELEQVSLLDESDLIALYTGPGPIDYQNIERAQIRVSGTAYFVWELNQEMIAESFTATQKTDIELHSKQIPSIGSARITNHPRWRNTLPLDEENIVIREIAIEKQPR